MKKIICAAIAAITALTAVPTAFAANNNITVTVDGKKVNFTDQQPVNINGRVMVPVRNVAEAMGWGVSFEQYPTNESPIVNGRFQDLSHVILTKNVKADDGYSDGLGYLTNITLETNKIVIGSKAGYDDAKSLIANTVVKNDRTLLGIRDIAEGMYADVTWDDSNKTVVIKTKPIEQFPNYSKVVEYIKEYNSDKEKNTENGEQQKAEEKTTEEQKVVEEVVEKDYAEEMLSLVNSERIKAGVEPLQLDRKLMKAAQIRANELKEEFSHTRPNGEKCSTVFEEINTEKVYGGENIAGGNGLRTSESAMLGWMNSSGHKANILRSNVKYIGVGYVYDENSTYKCNWVQIFAF